MINLTEYRNQRSREISEKFHIDALILSLPEHIHYFSGFFPAGMKILHTTESYLVLNPNNGRMGLITSASDVPTILENGYEQNIYPMGSFTFSLPNEDTFSQKIASILTTRYYKEAEAIAVALKDLAPGSKTVAVDESRMSISTWRGLRNELGDRVDLVTGTQIINEIKRVKHPWEVEQLRISTNIAEDALYSVIAGIRIGMSESDIEQEYRRKIVDQGCDPYFCIATIDERAAFSDTENRNWNKVKLGSVIRFDFGCIFQNFRSDMARTVVVGSNKKAEAYYRAILEGEECLLNAIKPGVLASDLFTIAVSATREAGIPHYQRHHVGHGIGIATYDMPSLSATNHMALEENMVLCVETPYYEIGWGGVQVEDTVRVTTQGFESLSKSPRTLVKIDG